ncbi:uncharacterized protein LOC127663421 isoform X2 [Xyrauchen texanus]|uniref:uncharacterized protein LOC127663421 isoform X2 n=1 Tax=Xyrauchen texanus TaxID=154827 RepID=UPI00224289E6|nr:uncharacterized protein LOC127663421 isoform X2 [Xyrauchen texanus]
MLFIFGLLLLLKPTVTCVEMFCRFNQTDPCYAALGHKLYLQMVTDARDQNLTLFKWIDNKIDGFINVKKNKISNEHESIKNRSEFIFNNGTLIINSVIRTDSGRYRLEIYDSTGTQTHDVNLPVIVEAPVGSVELSIICSGEMRASCSSEGDQLIFSWTLNGQELEDRNNIIHLDEETSGNITCTVNNHVSRGQKIISVNRCPVVCSVSVVFVVVWSLEMMLLLTLLGGFHIYITYCSTHTSVECSLSVVFVMVWSLEMMLLLTLLGGFHIYIRYCSTHTSGRKQEEEIAL